MYERPLYPPVPIQGAPSGAPAPYDPRFAGEPEADEIDLRRLWSTVVRYRWTIAAVTAAIFTSTIVATLLMRPVYRGTALVEIEPGARSLIRLNTVEHGIDGRTREYLETQWRILQSESVAEAVIARLGLEEHPELNGAERQRGFLGGLRDLLAWSGLGGEEPRDGRTRQWRRNQAFLERVDVQPVRDSNLVAVSFDSFDPELAAKVANAIVEEYVRLNDLRRIRSASGAKEFLEDEIGVAQSRLEDSERTLNEFARAQNIFDVDERKELVATRVSELSSELTKAVSARIAAEALHGELERSQAGEIPAELQNEVIAKLSEARANKSAQVERLSGIYKAGYPKLVQLRAQLQEIDASLQREAERLRQGVEADFQEARSREDLLRKELAQEKAALLDLRDRAVQYHILKRDWETNAQLHAGLLEQMKEIGVSVGIEVSNASLIDPAKVPVRPDHPRPLVNAAVSLVLGLGAGLGLALLLGKLDDGVRSVEDVESVSGLVSLGVVPKVELPELLADGVEARLPDQPTHNPVTESLRSVRTNLLEFSAAASARVLMVTSAMVGEGKTTTAVNLSIVLAQGGAHVLLVDGDLRRPRVHKVFGISRTPGLSELLAGRTEDPVQPTQVPGLSLIAAGDTPADPANLLGRLDVGHLLRELGRPFDYVIVDSAPVLGLADSPVVGTKVDGVLLVVSADAARRRAVRDAVKRMRMVRAPLLGVLLNKADFRGSAYGYYGKYYYQYASASSPQADAPFAA
jgi:succinoglycan biosynthesis transport protein ExoP